MATGICARVPALAFQAEPVTPAERRSGITTPLPSNAAADLTRALVAYRKAGCTILGLAADGDIELTSLDPDIARGPVVLVVGGEGKGLGRLVGETCDHIVSIPMASAAESLNASVAAGVALYAVAALRSS